MGGCRYKYHGNLRLHVDLDLSCGMPLGWDLDLHLNLWIPG